MKKTTLIFIVFVSGILGCKDDPIMQNVVFDIDGNKYGYVEIGEQIWLTSNLATTRLNDGTRIVLQPDSTIWFNLSEAAFCWTDNDPLNRDLGKGALYNAYAVSSQKLCPNGWHVPTETEMMELEKFIGMPSSIAYNLGWRGTNEAKKLKSIKEWLGTDFTGTDEYGFNAIPTGSRQNWHSDISEYPSGF